MRTASPTRWSTDGISVSSWGIVLPENTVMLHLAERQGPYFSIVQRKVLAPNDFKDLAEVEAG